MNPFSLDDDDEKGGGEYGGGVGDDLVQGTFKDALIFLIDASSSMHELPSHHSDDSTPPMTPFQLSLSFAARMMQRKIIAQTKDKIGVILFNYDGSKQPAAAVGGNNNNAQVFIYKSLDQPNASRVQEIEKDIADPSPYKPTRAPSASSSAPLSTALWQCNLMFSAANTKKFDSQNIYIFTNNDNPNPSNDPGVFTNAGDLASARRIISVMAIADENRFNESIFYQRLLINQWRVMEGIKRGVPNSNGSIATSSAASVSSGSSNLSQISLDTARSIMDENFSLISPRINLDDMIDIVRKKVHTKRRLANFPLVLAPGVEIHVSLFNMFMESRIPTPIRLEAENTSPVKVTTRFMCDDTATFLTPDLILNSHTFGGEKVFVKKAEMTKLRNFGIPSMKLLGFRSMDKVEPFYNLQQAYFLHPDEDQVKGSMKGFVCLVAEMHEMGKVAMASLIARRNSPPKLCALWPQRELLDENKKMLRPSGLWMVVLPFRDDVRQPTVPESIGEASEEQVEAAKDLVNVLDLEKAGKPGDDIQPADILFETQNPKLQKHWAALESLALNKAGIDWDEAKDDMLKLPKQLAESEAVVEFSRKFMDAVGDTGEPSASTSKKRGAEGSSPAKASKRQRTGGDDDDGGEVDIAITVDNVATHTIPVLKLYCEKHKLSKSGKKDDLVSRVKQHLQNQLG